MDGVVVDFIGPLLRMYNELTGENVAPEDIKSYKTSNWVGDPYILRKLIDSVGFIRNLTPVPGAIDGINTLLEKGHEIVFVSNGTNCPTSGHEKRDWLKFYFNKTWNIPPLILTYYKHHVRGDCLVDDNVKNLVNLDPSTKGLIWHHNYNAEEQDYIRIYDWNHFIEWVDAQ